MQTENKKKVKLSIDEQIKQKEYKIEQEKNQLKILKQKQSEQKRKERTKRMIEKGAVFESIFKTTTEFTKDEFYELIAYLGTLDEIKIKIMDIDKKKFIQDIIKEKQEKLKENLSKNG